MALPPCSKMGKFNSPLLISLSRVAIMMVALGTAPIISRELGPSGRGLYATCLAALGLAPVIIGLGIPMAIRRLASIIDHRPVVRSAYRIAFLLLSPAFGLGVVVSILLVPSLTYSQRNWFLVAMSTTAFFVLVLCAQSVLIAAHRYSAIAVLHFIQPSVTAIVVFVFWAFSDLTLETLLWGYVAGTSLAALTAVVLLRVSVRGPRMSFEYLGRQGIKYAGSQIAETAASTVVLLLAVTTMGSYEAGLLAVSVTLATLPLALGYAIGSAVFGGVASASPTDLPRARASAIRAAFVVGILGAATLLIVTPYGLPLLFGNAFSPAVPAAVVLVASSLLLVVNYVATQVLGAEGRGAAMALWQVAGLVVAVVGLLCLSGDLGAFGAALSMAAGWLVTSAGCLRALRVGPSVLVIRPADLKACFDLCMRGKFILTS
ncbi:lipopolysaccharide biosynthesis protein [Rhodococcoides navarretei]|uniref:Oligosaccharide flippase family protein n=1 Tax=Rhodococcus navarretei TaxID=3128981 RepID=A0ABU9D1U3_9NOCA